MKKLALPLSLSLLSGLLLFAAWPVSPLTFLIFAGFVPLLWLERHCRKRGGFFLWTLLVMLIWNILTTWWICNSTGPGGIAAMIANSLIMCIPWIAFRNVKRRMGEKWGYASLLLFWLTFEYIHLNWELSWPWLNLGNVFAGHPDWVQWYEITGPSGGTAWVLSVNILLFLLLRKVINKQAGIKQILISLLALLIIPFITSILLIPSSPEVTSAGNAGAPPVAGPQGASPDASALNNARSPLTSPNVVIVQPNIDPWDEKFAAGTQEAQLQKLIRQSDSQIDNNTALVVWPETAIPFQVNEDKIRDNRFLLPVWDFLRRHPSINLLTGMEGFRLYNETDRTPTSSRIPESNTYVDAYNSAVILDSNHIQVYHKSKLVPGAETLPSFLRFMTPLFEKFGGTSNGYTRQAERTVLHSTNHSYQVAPAVCYESIYGDFMTGFIRNGADLIVVITNDGWWGNTAGYRQHEQYARLLAIESRRWVVRSANTGISCFIDPAGKIADSRPWNQTATLKREIPPVSNTTFFANHGDLLSKIAIVLTLLLVCLNVYTIFKHRRQRG